ncbi:MAG TPA: hypothetical protein VG993_01785 [Actinomycetota bacterium]|jgi:hypothetical protein|nr:hypothetical protein [Actinomycetota bacterium]
MTRVSVFRTILRAATPREIADALVLARAWLSQHPDDEGCREEMARLLDREHSLIRS